MFLDHGHDPMLRATPWRGLLGVGTWVATQPAK